MMVNPVFLGILQSNNGPFQITVAVFAFLQDSRRARHLGQPECGSRGLKAAVLVASKKVETSRASLARIIGAATLPRINCRSPTMTHLLFGRLNM
jgi:hypothetical protein